MRARGPFCLSYGSSWESPSLTSKMAAFGAGVFKWLRPVFLCSSRKSAYFMPVYLEILNFKRKRASQVRKFSALLCMGRCKSQGSLNPILYILATWGLSFCFLSVSLRFTTGSSWSGCHLRTARRQAFPFPRAPWLPWKGCNRWLRLSGLPLLVMNDHYLGNISWSTFVPWHWVAHPSSVKIFLICCSRC